MNKETGTTVPSGSFNEDEFCTESLEVALLRRLMHTPMFLFLGWGPGFQGTESEEHLKAVRAFPGISRGFKFIYFSSGGPQRVH